MSICVLADEMELHDLMLISDDQFTKQLTRRTLHGPGDSPLVLKTDLVGERPGGETPSNSLLVELALEATNVWS
jgi:hypothetical protein